MGTKRNSKPVEAGALRPMRMAVLRGLGLILPPLLTIVFLLWIFGSVQRYVLDPIESLASRLLVTQIIDVKLDDPGDGAYVELESGEWVPRDPIFETVRKNPGYAFPTTAEAMYDRYVEIRWLKPSVTVPIFLCLLIILCYLLGKLIAARVGRILWTYFERVIDQLPFIRTVYGTVKQVTDIVFAEAEVQYTRVVAVQYPRQGVWSVGFVTGESLTPIEQAAGEPVLSVLMPTSPMPATGFTISIRKSETIELDLTVDQAFQFVVSCGVVAPGVGTREDVPAADVKTAIEAQVNA